MRLKANHFFIISVKKCETLWVSFQNTFTELQNFFHQIIRHNTFNVLNDSILRQSFL